MSVSSIVTLADLLSPLTVQEFTSEILGKKVCHIKGNENRFTELFSWDDLNSILQRHRLDYPRIRLVKDGKDLLAENFLQYIHSRQGEKIPRINQSRLYSSLQDGYVLVLNYLEEIIDPLRALAVNLGEETKEYVIANLYVGFPSSQGFALHKDPHDVYILQVYGRKNWKIFSNTSDPPKFLVGENDTSQCFPEWEGNLNSGEVLYVPKGWWHVASADRETSTMHITISVCHRTGRDYLLWLLTKGMREHELSDVIPKSASPADIEEYTTRLFADLKVAADRIGVRQYLEAHSKEIRRKPALRLPSLDQHEGSVTIRKDESSS